MTAFLEGEIMKLLHCKFANAEEARESTRTAVFKQGYTTSWVSGFG
jgi:hypothetical protein